MATKPQRDVQYVIQRLVHKSFGTLETHWHDFSWESAITNKNRKLMESFITGRDNPKIADKICREVAEANPHDMFRTIQRIVTTAEVADVTYLPRKQLTLADLREIAKNPPNHDGVRIFNGLVNAIKEAGLDPCNFGAISSKLVLHALKTLKNPKDEWILVLPECYETVADIPDYIDDREWWNLKQKAKIKYDGSIGSYSFVYIDYKKGKSSDSYKSFESAVKHGKTGKGWTKRKAKMPNTKVI